MLLQKLFHQDLMFAAAVRILFFFLVTAYVCVSLYQIVEERVVGK